MVTICTTHSIFPFKSVLFSQLFDKISIYVTKLFNDSKTFPMLSHLVWKCCKTNWDASNTTYLFKIFTMFWRLLKENVKKYQTHQDQYNRLFPTTNWYKHGCIICLKTLSHHFLILCLHLTHPCQYLTTIALKVYEF